MSLAFRALAKVAHWVEGGNFGASGDAWALRESQGPHLAGERKNTSRAKNSLSLACWARLCSCNSHTSLTDLLGAAWPSVRTSVIPCLSSPNLPLVPVSGESCSALLGDLPPPALNPTLPVCSRGRGSLCLAPSISPLYPLSPPPQHFLNGTLSS